MEDSVTQQQPNQETTRKTPAQARADLQQEFPHSVAVVVGINRYDHGIPALTTAAPDATFLADLLARPDYGYRVERFLDEEATRANLATLFTRTLPALLGPQDRLLLYFAGHGIALDGDDGPAGYLLPQNADPAERSTYLAMTDLHAWLAALECRHLLAILDCCFAGAFRWASTRALRPLPKVLHDQRYLRFIRDRAWQVLTSAAYNQTALDILAGDTARGLRDLEGQPHSPFAAALFAALAGAGDLVPAGTGDGVITASELYVYLRDSVEVVVEEQASHPQTPGLWPLKKHGGGEYIFLVPNRELVLQPAPQLSYATNPYRGLASYEERDSALFFGRGDEIAELAARVEQQPFVAVLGASGTGKSSLVKAGLLPFLRSQRAPAAWSIPPPLRPTAIPLATLSQWLTTNLAPPAAPPPDETRLQSDENALAHFVSGWKQAHPGEKLLLVVDQLEEAITLCRDEFARTRFLDLLANALRQHADVFHVVVTLRSDFEPQFTPTRLFREHEVSQPAQGTPAPTDPHPARYVVPPMDQDDLRQAIEGPAAASVLYFDPPELVDTLINEVVAMPGALPLLSFTLSELYVKYIDRQNAQTGETQVDRSLTRADFEQLGGAIGSLRVRANEEYSTQVQAGRGETMRRIMLRMVSLEGGELARRRVFTSELNYPQAAENTQVGKVVDRLIKVRLLVAGETGATVEPAHDALIRAWPQLSDWLEAERQRTDNLEFQRLTGQAAAVWEAEVAKGAPTPKTVWQLFRRRLQEWTRRWLRLGAEAQAGLLWDDVARSSLLEQVLASPRHNWLNAAEERFARASIEQRRLNRRLRNLAVGVLSILFVTATIMAVLAVRNDVLAEGQRGETLLNQSTALTSLARQQLETDPVAAIRLSLAALPSPEEPRPYSPAAEGTLTRALQLSLEEKYLPATAFVGTQNELAGSVAFTPGLIAVGGDGLRLIDTDLAVRATLAPTGTSRGATQVAWGDSGQLLSYDQEAVQLWQGDSPVATTGAADLGGAIRWAGWQPAGARVAILAGRSLWLWGDKTQPPQELWSFRSAPQGARWAPDGRRLAAWNELDDLLVWDVAGGRLLFRQDRVHDDHIGDVAWAQDGARLVTTAADGIVKVWNMEASGPPLSLDERLAPEAEPGRSERQGVQFLDERRFLTWRNYDRAGLARLWTVDGELLGTYDAAAGRLGGLGIALDEDNSCLLSLHETGDIYLWSLDPPTPLARLTGNRGLVDDVAWYQEQAAPGGLCNALSAAEGNPPAEATRYLAAATRDGAIHIWDLSRLEPASQQAQELASVAVLRGHAAVPGRQDNGVLGVRWLQGGRLLSYGVDGSFRIWQVLDEHGLTLCAGENSEGVPRCFRGSRLLLGHDGYVNRLGWLPDGRLLSTGWDGTLRAWTAGGAGRVVLANDPDTPRLVEWNPSGTLALVYPDPLFFANQEELPPDGEIWNLAAGEPVARVPGPVISAFWLPQGLLISAGQPTEPGGARLVEPQTGATLLTLAEPTLLLDAVALHGARLATAEHDGALHVWDLNTGAVLGTAHPCGWIAATHVAWRPDGETVIAGGDRGIAIWDTKAAGEPRCENLGEVTALALSQDGRDMAVGTADGFRIVDVESGATSWHQTVAGEVIKSVQWLDGKEWEHQNFYSWLVNILPQWLTNARWLRTGARPLLLTLSNDSVRLWDVAAQTEIWRADNGASAAGDTILETVAVGNYDAAGAHIAVGDYDGGIRVWEIYPQAPESWAAIAAGEEYSTRALPGIP